jgi:dual oxidase maturation factor 1
MSIAWFDAFRENGAPTWYGDNTPTPVLFDLGLVVIIWLFATPTIAFILILPGIRRFRALSTFCFLFSITIGASIALCLHYPGWHYGEVKIFTTLRAHSRQRIAATLGVNVGLTHVNITLNFHQLKKVIYLYFYLVIIHFILLQ